jgi:uncharacterized membrane protein HdeD (DUF308 family)
VVGFFIMANPPEHLAGVIAVMALFLVLSGLVRLARAQATQFPGRGWTAMMRLVAVLLGACVWTGWPVNKLWFIGLCLALALICHGVAWSALGLTERKPLQAPAA